MLNYMSKEAVCFDSRALLGFAPPLTKTQFRRGKHARETNANRRFYRG